MGTQYSQLTLVERNLIETFFKRGKTLSEIASVLGRNKSTISREIYRNAWQGQFYFGITAQTLAANRRTVASSQMKIDFDVWLLVEEKLKLKWAPDQISKRLNLEGAGKISVSTIYKWIWLDRRGGGDLFRNLRISNRYRKKRNLPLRQRGPIRDEKRIEIRPKIVEKRKRLGDLEGDTIHFSRDRKAGLLTVTDRVSKSIKIRKLRRRQARTTARQMSHAIARMKPKSHTLTLDRGPEFSMFKKIETKSNVNVYFADPYCASQRGSIENQNGLIRQFFGRKHDIKKTTASQIQRVERLLNSRPRKSLGYLSPNEFENNRTLIPMFST